MHRHFPLGWPRKPQWQGRVALLQYAPIRLKALKPKETDSQPKTLGQHLRRRRIELGLTQKQAAAALGLSPFTVLNLEKDRTEAPITAYPVLIRWLGYGPFPAPKTLQERMRAARRNKGWTIAKAAARLGIDPATWGDWERTGRVAWERNTTRLQAFLQATLREK